ncbi:hypothetical protein [Vibrio vulnificus]|uniref:hypothetical protein n=1 Tax=Vibrio vulnificus TaxID=672 RepID=UPI00102395ED|nr:hypothetical protein [Vibrio vulnificus]RZQ33254.1 hypothetical protein D8T38_18600 [Vibrio vulnificus]
MNITLFKTMVLTAAIVVTNSSAAPAIDQDTKSWVSGVNTQLNTTFNSADPNVVPSFSTNATGTEHYMNNPNLMASDSVTEAATDEAAQLMRGIPQKPDVANEAWYQNAHNITKNPKDEIGGLTGEYTDCVEVTTPGATHSEVQTCTETANTTTASCTSDLKIEVDSDHFYSCKKELNTTNENCTVGRVIDVTQSHRYSCQQGRLSRTKSCNDTLDVTIERARFKYRPQPICEFTNAQYQSNSISSSILSIPKSNRFDYSQIKDSSWVVSRYKKENSCSVYKQGKAIGSTFDEIYIFSGTEKYGCRTGDSIWDSDGMCHSDNPIEFTNALPECSESELRDGLCVDQPSWIYDFKKANSGRDGRLASYGWGSSGVLWALLDGSGAYYWWSKKKRINSGDIVVANLVGNAPGYPATAQIKVMDPRGSIDYGAAGFAVSILLSSGNINVPTFKCNSNRPPEPGSNMCSSSVGYSEYRIVESWNKTCN